MSNKDASFADFLQKIKADFANFKFEQDTDFRWSPQTKTIYFNPTIDQAQHLLLHELGHASLNHADYTYDAELIKMELEAWQRSKEHFYPKYLPEFNQELADYYLNYYREWLYERSVCPNCGTVGQQINSKDYACLSCQQHWRPNQAKQTVLKRRKLK